MRAGRFHFVELNHYNGRIKQDHHHSEGILRFVKYCILQTSGFLLNDKITKK
jgi:hypothetical protein